MFKNFIESSLINLIKCTIIFCFNVENEIFPLGIYVSYNLGLTNFKTTWSICTRIIISSSPDYSKNYKKRFYRI